MRLKSWLSSSSSYYTYKRACMYVYAVVSRRVHSRMYDVQKERWVCCIRILVFCYTFGKTCFVNTSEGIRKYTAAANNNTVNWFRCYCFLFFVTTSILEWCRGLDACSNVRTRFRKKMMYNRFFLIRLITAWS